MALTYDQFIENIGVKQYMKCLNINLNHNNFQYKLGPNEDFLPFNPVGSCNGGGLYFTTSDHIHEFINYGPNIAIIELCTDAIFYIDPDFKHKFKTNKFIIKKIIKQTEEICKKAVEYDPVKLLDVEEQTEEICKIAVAGNSYMLRYVWNQTDEICKIAIANNCYMINHVKNQTEELCKMAVQENGLALEYIKKQTDEICKLAVQQNGEAYRYVKNQTDEIYRLAEQQIRYRKRHEENEVLPFLYKSE